MPLLHRLPDSHVRDLFLIIPWVTQEPSTSQMLPTPTAGLARPRPRFLLILLLCLQKDWDEGQTTGNQTPGSLVPPRPALSPESMRKYESPGLYELCGGDLLPKPDFYCMGISWRGALPSQERGGEDEWPSAPKASRTRDKGKVGGSRSGPAEPSNWRWLFTNNLLLRLPNRVSQTGWLKLQKFVCLLVCLFICSCGDWKSMIKML